MEKAFDTILLDYVDAVAIEKSGDFEPFRYLCALCWQDVILCAADSEYQAAHFRHHAHNNNAKCDNYHPSRFKVISDAQSNKNIQKEIGFFFSSSTKLFSIGVKFSESEISEYESNHASLEVRESKEGNIIASIPINTDNFTSDAIEHIPISVFSWEYFISFSNSAKKTKHMLFHKDDQGYQSPIFFKIQSSNDDYAFQAKLVSSRTLYCNTRYLMASKYSQQLLNFKGDAELGNEYKFKTMSRDFACTEIVFTNITNKTKRMLEAWKYKLEPSETAALLWPPSSREDDLMLINSKHAFVHTSFELKAHVNTNANTDGISEIEESIYKVYFNERVKIHRKNAELELAKRDNPPEECQPLLPSIATAKKYQAKDDGSFVFNRLGASQMSIGMVAQLSKGSEVRHYTHGYLDSIIKAPLKPKELDDVKLIDDILKHYKRQEMFIWDGFERHELSPAMQKYIESCKKAGIINTAAKRFIEEGRL